MYAGMRQEASGAGIKRERDGTRIDAGCIKAEKNGMECVLTVYGIQFRPSGQIYFFSSGGLALAVNDAVVVNTDQGESLGRVVQILANPPAHDCESPVEPGVPGLSDIRQDAPDAAEDSAGVDAPQDESLRSLSKPAKADDAATPATGAQAEQDAASFLEATDASDMTGPVETAAASDNRDSGAAAGPDAENAEAAHRNIKPVTRRATREDFARLEENKAIAVEARHICRRYIQNLRLDMKLVDVDIFLDRSKYIFYFTAPNRIDFRELVKELVRQFRTRIELRQIGVRNETQMVGGVGNCGMPCCCRRYIRKFVPVTIKMAKEQNLFLNPAKISGTCGRLLCCLAYEQSNYEEFHSRCPKFGKKYATARGTMKVLRANLFRNSVSALNENNEEQEFSLEEWQSLKPVRPDNQHNAARPNAASEAGAEQSAKNGATRQENARNRKNDRNPNGIFGLAPRREEAEGPWDAKDGSASRNEAAENPAGQPPAFRDAPALESAPDFGSAAAGPDRALHDAARLKRRRKRRVQADGPS